MRNYFNYFTEIEERFQQRRGVIHMLSTLDWALIDIWREAGIPLEALCAASIRRLTSTSSGKRKGVCGASTGWRGARNR